MMRYHRVSPDCVPLASNGKKPSGMSGAMHQTPPPPPLLSTNNTSSSSSHSTLEPNKALRFRSPSRTPDQLDHISDFHHDREPEPEPEPEPSPSDMLLQWGHRKRPRASRAEIRPLADDSSSSSSAQARHHHQPPLKSQRRLVGPTTMPPPPTPTPTVTVPSSLSNGRASRKDASGSVLNRLRDETGSSPRGRVLWLFYRFALDVSTNQPTAQPYLTNNSWPAMTRNLEDRSVAVNGSSPSRTTAGGSNRFASRSATGKRSPPPVKTEGKISSSTRAVYEKLNGSSVTHAADRNNHVDSASLLHHGEQDAGNSNYNTCGGAPKEERTSVDAVREWPKIQIPLSRKEKEEDFLAMRGSKLPQRPKKRPKNVERALQYVFPGTWLSEVTRSRYEVREKKCVKKQKRRGLKGMESVDSDSE